jgi:hypothetical protein
MRIPDTHACLAFSHVATLLTHRRHRRVGQQKKTVGVAVVSIQLGRDALGEHIRQVAADTCGRLFGQHVFKMAAALEKAIAAWSKVNLSTLQVCAGPYEYRRALKSSGCCCSAERAGVA